MREEKEEARVTIDIVTPETWSVKPMFRIGKHHVAGMILAFSPRVMALGVEGISGYAKGLALMVGPFWIGFAAARIERSLA